MTLNRYLAACAALSALLSCSGEKTAPATHSPSKVENGVPESALTTVTLTPEAERRLGVTTAAVDVRSAPNMRAYAGVVGAAPGASAVVAAPFAGVVAAGEAGLLTPGSAVERGQSILLLRGVATQTSGISPAEEIRVRKIELDNAKARRRRTAELVAAEGASEEELEAASADVARAQAAYNSVNAQLSGGDAGAAVVRAPLAGVISDYAAGLGQLISAGATLFTVTNLDAALVRVPVYPGDADAVPADAPAQVRSLNADADAPAIDGVRIAGSPTATAGAIDLYFAIDNSATKFRPGERVEVSLPVGGAAERLVVPHAAIFTDIHGGSWVYEKAGEGVYARRRVVIDHLAGDLAVLAAGPPKGTLVATAGVAELAGSEFGVGK